MKTIKLFSIIAAVALVSACNPNLLNIPQMGVTSEESFYETDNDCEQATAAVYNASRKVLSGKYAIGSYEDAFHLKNLLSDDIRTGSSRTDQTNLQQIWELHLLSTNQWFQRLYEEYYSTIYLANLVMEKFGEKAKDSKIMTRDIAECRGLRALAYYDLVTLWGRVPLVTKVLKTKEDYQVANTEIADIWKFIEDELVDIINSGVLTQRNGTGDVNGSARFTIDAARTLLGKAYMYQGKSEQAWPVLKDVIDSRNFGLIDDVRQLYHIQANGCEEYVYENVRHFDLTNAYDQDGWHGILWNWGFSYSFFMGDEARNFHNFSETGYMQCQVSKDLYDAFVAEEGVNGKRVTAWIMPYEKLPEIDVAIKGGRVSFYNSEGYLRLKWLVTRDDEYVAYWHANQANTPVFKYDDVLLLAAEAGLNSHKDLAIDYVNQVRARANLAPISELNLDIIKKERRLELAMDGVRFQDLKRWGDAPKVLANKSTKLPTLTVICDPGNTEDKSYKDYKYTYELKWTDNDYPDAGWTVGRDDYLPFPQNEIDVNKALQQNPGY